MKQINVKKLLLPNLPYVFIALFATKLGQAARLAPGADFSQKASGFAAADLRSLRDLTASIKELAVLIRDLDGGTREERTIHVCFAGGTEDCTG